MLQRETALQTSKIPLVWVHVQVHVRRYHGYGTFRFPGRLLTVHLMIEHRGQRWGGGCSRARQARANSVPSSLARACRGTGPLLPLRGARALGLEESHVYELKCVVLFVRSVLGCSVTTRAVHATLAANSQHLGATEGERCRSTHSTSTCTESPGRRSSCVRPCSTLSRIRPRASSRSSTFCTSIWWAIRMPSGGARSVCIGAAAALVTGRRAFSTARSPRRSHRRRRGSRQRGITRHASRAPL